MDLKGMVFDRLTVISQDLSRSENYGNYWLCICACGTTHSVRTDKLVQKQVRSCGCLRRELGAQKNLQHGDSDHTPEHRAWSSMRQRCNNPEHANYEDYGGRGITVCDSWLYDRGYEKFLEDMGRRPGPGYSLERVKNHLGYSKENCIWATRKAQANNRRGNRLLTLHGKTQTLAQWADEYGMTANCLGLRLLNGDSLEAALSKPVMVRSPRGRHT